MEVQMTAKEKEKTMEKASVRMRKKENVTKKKKKLTFLKAPALAGKILGRLREEELHDALSRLVHLGGVKVQHLLQGEVLKEAIGGEDPLLELGFLHREGEEEMGGEKNSLRRE